VVPLAIAPLAFAPAARVLGLALIVLGVAVLVPAPLLFLRYRTTIVPHREASALITGGPYRISRNPMYLGLTLGYVGLALVVNQLWPLLLLALPLWVMQTKIIPIEEARMLGVFGDEYRAYCQRVRRWL
jgi:protein-S-isoprenylcysteine O-methyltransferase Ste14